MRALIVYESMYGNTHAIAEAIGEGLRPLFEVSVVPVAAASPVLRASADLLVVGGPTHIHGMSSATSRKAALEAADKPGSPLAVDPVGSGAALRDWLDELPKGDGWAAAFDTRIDGPSVLTGRASTRIAKRLLRHGYRLVLSAESFLVDKDSLLADGELARARAWGATLARKTPLQARAR